MAQLNPEPPMTAEAFATFSNEALGDARCELLDGRVYTMVAERATHARMKNAILRQLEARIAALGLSYEAFPDGMAVRVDNANVFEPDVSVRCGPRVPGETTMITDPVIVIEIASTSTQRVDVLVKFARYFRNPSIAHYLIVAPRDGLVLHHRRVDGRIQSTSHESGVIDLTPPGLTLDLTRLMTEISDRG